MARRAVRGISAPPEVVFNTAMDPRRRVAWLPAGLQLGPADVRQDTFEIALTAASSSGTLRVLAGDSGGSSVELSVPDDGAAPEEILDDLNREVAENLNAG